MGPFLNGQNETSESFKILKQIGDGTFKKWIPKMGIGLVDVRDVANAHFLAASLKMQKADILQMLIILIFFISLKNFIRFMVNLIRFQINLLPDG